MGEATNVKKMTVEKKLGRQTAQIRKEIKRRMLSRYASFQLEQELDYILYSEVGMMI